jgi:hypothetical protein
MLSVALLACSSTPPAASTTPSTEPSAGSPAATIDADVNAFIASACLDSGDKYCPDTMRDALGFFDSGSFVAVCDYEDGTGDVVLLDNDDNDEAETACSSDGLIVPSHVVRIVQLP